MVMGGMLIFGARCSVNAYDIAAKPTDTETVTFHQANMKDINGNHDLMYSRFSLHSVPEDIEDFLLAYSKTNCKYMILMNFFF